jgi:hypothetical protein
MFEANPTIRNPHDGTAFAIHCGLISGGLIPEGKGRFNLPISELYLLVC